MVVPPMCVLPGFRTMSCKVSSTNKIMRIRKKDWQQRVFISWFSAWSPECGGKRWRVRPRWVEYACGELRREREDAGWPGVRADDSERIRELHWSVLEAVKVPIFHSGKPGVFYHAGRSESKAGESFILVASIWYWQEQRLSQCANSRCCLIIMV